MDCLSRPADMDTLRTFCAQVHGRQDTLLFHDGVCRCASARLVVQQLTAVASRLDPIRMVSLTYEQHLRTVRLSPCRACARCRHLQHPRVCTSGAAGGRPWHRLGALAAARCGDAASSTTAARQHTRLTCVGARPGAAETAWTPGHGSRVNTTAPCDSVARRERPVGILCAHAGC